MSKVDPFMVRVAAQEYLDEQDRPRSLRRTLTLICYQRDLWNLGEVLDVVAELRGGGQSPPSLKESRP